MATFNYQKAIEAGYTPDEIDAFVKKNKLTVRNLVAPTQTPQPTATPIPEINPQVMRQPSFSERVGQGVVNIGKSIASPFARTGKNIAGGLLQAPLALRASDLANVVNDPNKSDEEKDNALKELRRVNQLNKLMAPFAESGKSTQSYKQNVGQVLQSPEVTKQAKDSLNVASYAVPFGKGANVLTKAVLPGTVVGAMQGASKDDATVNSVVGDALLGGVLAGGVYGASKIPGALKRAGRGVQTAGDKLVQAQINVPRSTATGLKLPETMSALNRYGYSKVDKIASGADDVIRTIDDTVQTSVSKAKPVKLDGFTEIAKDIVNDPSIKVGQDEKVLKFVDKLVQQMTKKGSGSQIKFEADPTETLGVIRTLQRKASDVAKGKLPANISDEERALKQAYNLLADELEERLYTVSGADKVVPGQISKLVTSLQKFSPELAKDASKVQTVAELRTLMAPFVRGKIASQTTELGRNLATETMGGAVKGVGKMIQNPMNIVAVPLGSDFVNAGTGNIIGKAGRVMQNTPGVPQVVSNVSANVASRLPSVVQPTNKQGAPNQDSQYNEGQKQEGSNIQSQVNHMDTTIPQLTTDVNKDPKDTKGASGYSYNELAKAYATAMMEGDSKLAGRIKGILELEKEALPKEATGQGTATERMNKNRATIGLRALQDAEKMLKEDPSLLAKGLIPGKILSRKYETAAVRTAEQILRMQTGATVTKEEARKYAQEFMPWFGDDPETIQYKLDQMKLDYEQFL